MASPVRREDRDHSRFSANSVWHKTRNPASGSGTPLYQINNGRLSCQPSTDHHGVRFTNDRTSNDTNPQDFARQTSSMRDRDEPNLQHRSPAVNPDPSIDPNPTLPPLEASSRQSHGAYSISRLPENSDHRNHSSPRTSSARPQRAESSNATTAPPKPRSRASLSQPAPDSVRSVEFRRSSAAPCRIPSPSREDFAGIGAVFERRTVSYRHYTRERYTTRFEWD